MSSFPSSAKKPGERRYLTLDPKTSNDNDLVKGIRALILEISKNMIFDK